MRLARAIRGGARNNLQQRVGTTEATGSMDKSGPSMGLAHHAVAHNPRKGLRTWHRVRNRMKGQEVDSQQWLVERNIPHVTHHVVMGIVHLDPLPNTPFNFPSPSINSRLHGYMRSM
ncbi:hypothetical protein ACFX15_012885 [Malus domestica]